MDRRSICKTFEIQLPQQGYFPGGKVNFREWMVGFLGERPT